MQENKVIAAIVIGTVVLMGLGVFLATKASKGQEIKENSEAKAVITEKTYDWGEIGINNGKVEHEFEIKNDGTSDLVLSGVTTSCMCTTAQLILDDQSSPIFGMHTKSNYSLKVPAGKSAKLKVIFDPAYHGPNGVGAITRQIKVLTNDPANSELEFVATAQVTK